MKNACKANKRTAKGKPTVKIMGRFLLQEFRLILLVLQLYLEVKRRIWALQMHV
jgi:hypothetical protein